MAKILTKNFKRLFWGYDFNSLDPQKDQQLIIVNTLNYGTLAQWRQLSKIYGKNQLKNCICSTPQSEFRQHAIKLIKLLFNINKFKYASRSAQIKTKRNI